jgi:hypothetical protein
MSLKAEVERLRRDVAELRGGGAGGPLQIIDVHGGMCDCEPVHATIEGFGSFDIGPDEALEDFKERAIGLAHASGARWVVIGHLQPLNGITEESDV